MKLSFTAVKMLLASVNARSEVHGENREPAGDIKLSVHIPNDILDDLRPGLKAEHYVYDAARVGQGDLVDEARKNEPGYLPHTKKPPMVFPIKIDDEMAGAKITIKEIGAADGIELQPVKVNDVGFEPMDGGTVKLTLRVQYHPDEKAAGKLAMLVQHDVEVTIEAEPQQGN